jgi:hypothetical protein
MTTTSGEQSGKCGDYGTVAPTESWSWRASLQDGQLMAQDEDLDLLGSVGAGVEHHPAQQLREHLVDQLHRHRRIMPRRPQPQSARSATVREVSGTNRGARVSQF